MKSLHPNVITVLLHKINLGRDRNLDWSQEKVVRDFLIHSLDKHLVLLVCHSPCTQKCLVPLRSHWSGRGNGTTGSGVGGVGGETLDLWHLRSNHCTWLVWWQRQRHHSILLHLYTGINITQKNPNSSTYNESGRWFAKGNNSIFIC